jgi:hypothetical protein
MIPNLFRPNSRMGFRWGAPADEAGPEGDQIQRRAAYLTA